MHMTRFLTQITLPFILFFVFSHSLKGAPVPFSLPDPIQGGCPDFFGLIEIRSEREFNSRLRPLLDYLATLSLEQKSEVEVRGIIKSGLGRELTDEDLGIVLTVIKTYEPKYEPV